MATPRTTVPEIDGLPERYQPRRYIAQGHYGDVVDAINRDRNNAAVALKLLRADGTNADVARAMFRREVEALQGLQHYAIVQILDWFECNDRLLGIELELIPGGRSLSVLFEDVRIGRKAPPAPEWRVGMAARLADAVLEAHRRNVIHRDIKPGNVLWNRDDDTLKLADFGIAAVLPLMVRDPGGLTLRSFYTRPFASPEQRLQNAAGSPSDVYGFGLLVASLLALAEPGETFEPKDLDVLIAGALAELRVEGVSAFDIDELSKTLHGALLDDAAARPSMTEIRAVLGRLQAVLVPRPQAAMVLTDTAKGRLAAVGFVADAKIVEDFNADLRVRVDRGDGRERIKLYGRSLFAVVIANGDDVDGVGEVTVIDAGQNPGPTHESNRRSAEPCPVRLRLGRGPSAALVSFAREADRTATRRATTEIVERARLIVGIERERLPVLAIDAVVEGGQRVAQRREERISQAAGYTGSQTEQVEVNGGFRLMVSDARVVPRSAVKNIVRARLQASGVEIAEAELFDAPVSDWYALLDNPKDFDVFDDADHMVGKVVRFDRASQAIHVQTDKKRTLLRVGMFFVRNAQKEGLLRKQEVAIDKLERGETARPDMPQLLAESAVHVMGEKPWITLMQGGLTPEARVKDLVNRILASKTAFCLQGPPGTGKTTIISEVVAQTLELDPRARILVCSQANDAVANAVERILKVRGKVARDWLVVRDVRPERAKEEGPWAGYEAAYREFTTRVGAAARAAVAAELQTQVVREAVEEWLECVEHGARQVRRDHHGLVQVWGTTTARSTGPLRELDGEPYDLVIIDEAAKATVGEVLVAVVNARRLFFVGDEKQLPPFLEDTTTKALEELGVSEEQAKYSLFEHLFALVPAEHRDMLDVQYRMHTTIGDVVSRLFYDGKVRNGLGTDKRPLPPGDFDRPHRVMWVDVAGRDYKVGPTSRANDLEREAIYRLLGKLDADAGRAGMTLEVAVIAAYRGQADKLIAELRVREAAWKWLHVKAATVDSFQGREADVVLYSLVRVGDAERKFLADGRRFNVALSRARSLLVLVGDRPGARGTPRLKHLLEMIPEENQVEETSFIPKTALGSQLATALNTKATTPNRKR